MRFDIEHGFWNRIYRMFAAFIPLRVTEHTTSTPQDAYRMYARGNVNMQLGMISTEEECEQRIDRVLKHAKSDLDEFIATGLTSRIVCV